MQHLNFKAFLLSMTLSTAGFGKGLVVISGGYQSCPRNGEFISLPHVPEISKIVKAAQPFISAVSQKEDGVDVIWSCFSGVKSGWNPYKVISKGPMTFQFGSHGTVISKIDYNSADIDNGRPISPFFRYVENYIDQNHPSAVYVAGHSFGGWTAMQLGTRLAGKQVTIDGMILIDPISPFQCPANVMATSVAIKGDSPVGCHMAPRDLLVRNMEELAHQSKWLVNFYQTKFATLHSSALSCVGWDNRMVTNFPNVAFGDVHTYLGTSSVPWLFSANQVK